MFFFYLNGTLKSWRRFFIALTGQAGEVNIWAPRFGIPREMESHMKQGSKALAYIEIHE